MQWPGTVPTTSGSPPAAASTVKPPDEKPKAPTLAGSIFAFSGEASSQEEKEKILLALGNVEGVAGVEDSITVAQAAPEARFVTVKKGDTLSAIAKAEYGNANAYMKIFEANKPMLSHPDKIYPGQVLRIPE